MRRPKPDLPLALGALCNVLRTRFERTGRRVDIDRAVAIGEQAVSAARVHHPGRLVCLSNLGLALRARYRHTGGSADLDRESRLEKKLCRALWRRTPNDLVFLSDLSVSLLERFKRTHEINDLNRTVTVGKLALSTIAADHTDRPGVCNNVQVALLTRFEHSGNEDDLVQAIDAGQQALATVSADHPDRAGILATLGQALLVQFDRTTNAEDLDRAIELSREAVAAIPVDHPESAFMLGNFAQMLMVRFRRTDDRGDLEGAIAALREASTAASARITQRIRAAKTWGRYAAVAGNWDEAVEGFAAAVALSVLLAPRELARADQEYRLRELIGLGSEAAAAALQARQAQRAVELFEQGRAVLFSRILHTRSDLSELRREHPQLAREFANLRDIIDDAGDASRRFAGRRDAHRFDQPSVHRPTTRSGRRVRTRPGRNPGAPRF